MLPGPLRSGDHSLGFKPHHKPCTVAVYGLSDGTKRASKARAVDGPVARCVCPVLAFLIFSGVLMPAGVEPEHIRTNAKLVVTVYHGNGILLRQARIFLHRLGFMVVETG